MGGWMMEASNPMAQLAVSIFGVIGATMDGCTRLQAWDIAETAAQKLCL